MSISISLTLVVLCLIAGAVGSFVNWLLTRLGASAWINWWLTLASTLLVFASIAVK